MEKFNSDEVMQQILNEQEFIAPAAEEMRQHLNEVVSAHNLTGTQVLLLMSRLSAAYIHSLKKFFNDEEAKAAVEDFFCESLQAHLTLSDFNDAQRNVELN
jgi:hypothetical protein